MLIKFGTGLTLFIVTRNWIKLLLNIDISMKNS
jgi:hypothetical protein